MITLPGGEHRILQIRKFLLDHAPLLVAQLLGQHLLGGGGGHAAEVILLGGDIQHHGVAHLGVVGDLLHFGQGDLVVVALHLLHDDLGGQHPVALLVEVELHVEVGEVVLLERVFADAQIEGAAVALVALEQGFAQGGLHHRGGKFLLFADVLDQVVETGEQDQSHGGSSVFG
jgi:hypothetical protein